MLPSLSVKHTMLLAVKPHDARPSRAEAVGALELEVGDCAAEVGIVGVVEEKEERRLGVLVVLLDDRGREVIYLARSSVAYGEKDAEPGGLDRTPLIVRDGDAVNIRIVIELGAAGAANGQDGVDQVLALRELRERGVVIRFVCRRERLEQKHQNCAGLKSMLAACECGQ